MLAKGYKYKKLSAAKSAQIVEAGKIGRLVYAAQAIQRRKDYNASPNYCLECGNPLLVPLEDTRGQVFAAVKNKKFCNQSCGAKYNNRILGYPRHKPKVRICSNCGVEYVKPYDCGTRCSVCKSLPNVSILGFRTKGESIIQSVRTHARMVLFKARSHECEICGYKVRVDCCHIKPIKNFSSAALLSEINTKENLVALCPNHHVELDLGLLKLNRGVVL